MLDTANSIIAEASERYSKGLWSTHPDGRRPRLITYFDEDDWDEKVLNQVLQRYEQGIWLCMQAVLFWATSVQD